MPQVKGLSPKTKFLPNKWDTWWIQSIYPVLFLQLSICQKTEWVHLMKTLNSSANRRLPLFWTPSNSCSTKNTSAKTPDLIVKLYGVQWELNDRVQIAKSGDYSSEMYTISADKNKLFKPSKKWLIRLKIASDSNTIIAIINYFVKCTCFS